MDSKVGDERQFPVTEAILSGEDPLWAIEKAAKVAIGSRWLDRCPEQHCRHYRDAETYLTVYQIINLLLSMGYVKDDGYGRLWRIAMYNGTNSQ